MNPLRVLQERIADRTSAIAQSHGAWPCRAGCDACCRSLADVPRMTEPEWRFLLPAIEALPPPIRETVVSGIRALEAPSRPITCPMLDDSDGRCLVYEARPIACRTYGFYRERDAGLYCGMIRERADAGEFDQVVWGNQESVAASLRQLGKERSLYEWSFLPEDGDRLRSD